MQNDEGQNAMNAKDQKTLKNFDYFGLYRDLSTTRIAKAQKEESRLSYWFAKLTYLLNAEVTRVGKFTMSRSLPDPAQDRLYQMMDAETEYGRRITDDEG